ncbi:MAG: NAD(P)-dependent alcohol dehydrogenase [Chloroflexi bacterium]|nr:NAD(P)-dependent alcohol dehydrogenase [Chloroflexota bacterium]
MKITAAIINEKSGPFQLAELDLAEPQADEVLVRIVATGVCHTDLVVRDQYVPVPLPVVLGHEGAGVVERVGANVKKVQPGDHVVLSFFACGSCVNCEQGQPGYCLNFFPGNFSGGRLDGSSALRQGDNTIHGHFFGQSSFATYALANEHNVVKVAKDVPLELLGPLGCGIQTGAGSVLNALRPEAGTSIAVFGVGPVGLSAIMAAKVAGCTTIIAVDVKLNRLSLASELGATHTINGAELDAVAEIQKIVPGGVNYSLETTAVPKVFHQAVESLGVRGVCGFVGVAPMGTQAPVDISTLLAFGRTIRGIVEGESVADVFIPRLIELYRQGRFPLDRLITFYPLEEINQAVKDSEQGTALKAVLRMPS